jgi:hypothetical protein
MAAPERFAKRQIRLLHRGRRPYMAHRVGADRFRYVGNSVRADIRRAMVATRDDVGRGPEPRGSASGSTDRSEERGTDRAGINTPIVVVAAAT